MSEEPKYLVPIPEFQLQALLSIERKPEMFGLNTLRDLLNFVSGWSCGPWSKDENVFFTDLARWMLQHYKYPPNCVWTLVVAEALGDTRRAIDTFYAVLRVFLKDRYDFEA